MVYRFDAPLYFANATLFLDDIERLVALALAPVKWHPRAGHIKAKTLERPPNSLQGVTKERIAEVLQPLNRASRDTVDGIQTLTRVRDMQLDVSGCLETDYRSPATGHRPGPLATLASGHPLGLAPAPLL
jgi:hypothetical protein